MPDPTPSPKDHIRMWVLLFYCNLKDVATEAQIGQVTSEGHIATGRSFSLDPHIFCMFSHHCTVSFSSSLDTMSVL